MDGEPEASEGQSDCELQATEPSDDREQELASRKRPVELLRKGESPDRAKRSNVADQQQVGDHVMIKVLVPSCVSGAIIGRHGETIANLQQETQARIKLSKTNEFFPDTSERVLTIIGAVPAIIGVVKFVCERIKDKRGLNAKNDIFDYRQVDRASQMKVVIADSTAGIVIGKAGERIRAIKESSNVQVKVSNRDSNSPERVVTIAGDVQAMLVALQMILEKVATDPHSMSHANLTYPGSTGISDAGRCELGVLDVGLPFAASPGCNIRVNNAFIDHLVTTLNSRGYTELAVMEIIGAVQVLAKYNVLGMAFHTTVSPTESDSLKSSNRGILDRPLPSLDDIPPSDLVKVRSEFGNKVELEVPDDIVGAVLGRKGDTLFEIQQKSGAKVEVSQRTSFAPYTTNRMVSISGSPSQLQKARAAINYCVNREQMRRKFRDQRVSQN